MIMATYKQLPSDYRERMQLNIRTNKNLKYGIPLWAIIIFVIMGYEGNQVQPFSRYLRGNLHQVAYVFLGMILYMILHEMVHGIFMYLFGRKRAHFGVKGPYSYASSEIYFGKLEYQIIALAPSLIWGIVLTILCTSFKHTDWFWTFYIIQIVNITGSVSDLYVVFRFLKLPSNALVHDSGTAIIVYGKT